MTHLPQLLTLAAVMLLACMSPGPDFVAVTSHALRDRRAGLGVATGVALACLLWATLAIFGLGLLLTRVAWAYEVIRIVGALYLVKLGIGMLLAARRGAPAGAEIPTAAAGGRSSLLRGLLVGLTNPKSAAFFGSLFVTVLPLDAPLWVQVATPLIVFAVALSWFATVAFVFSVERVRSGYVSIRRPIDALMGAVLVALGARLAVSS